MRASASIQINRGVIPAKAGIQNVQCYNDSHSLDSRLRGNDSPLNQMSCSTGFIKLFSTLVIITLFVVILSGSVSAFEKTSTTAATFLQIPVGGRLPAMGGAGVAYSGNAEMLSTNPAASLAGQGVGVSVSYIDWFAGLRHQSAAVVIPYNNDLSFGIHVISFSGDEFEQTTLTSQEGNGVMVNYGDLAIAASGISQLTDRFTVGVTGKLIRQTLFHTSASTFAFDVGTLLKTELEGLSIGMAMTNLGGEMQLDGRDLIVEPGGISGGETRLSTSAWSLPLTFQTGIAWNYYKSDPHSLLFAADAKHLNEGTTTVHLGMEYGFGETVYLRSGRILGHDTESWAFGFGIHFNIYDYSVTTDMAYADLGDLDTVERITISLTRRKNRE
ncbi:MAG: PorV/PorQ family protein [Candidatus Electryonea clarkiae]|nr:PorV/PorQ family protein [Candidatus Electryonea clarkiae]MDP8285512.1 PorV/PorQ family protein [Candidatus Electryonea clarkiae]